MIHLLIHSLYQGKTLGERSEGRCLSLCCLNKMLWAGWRKQHKFISHGSEARKFKTKVLADLVLGKSSLPGLHNATFPVFSHVAFP